MKALQHKVCSNLYELHMVVLLPLISRVSLCSWPYWMLFQSLFQLDDTEFSLQTAVKARKKLEDEVNDLQSQVDSLCKSKKEVRFLPLRLPSMCSPVPLSLLLCLVGWLVGWFLVLALSPTSFHLLLFLSARSRSTKVESFILCLSVCLSCSLYYSFLNANLLCADWKQVHVLSEVQ